jgi:hypothetical protein
MSGESAVISIPSANVGDVQPANFSLQHGGSVYRSAPAAAAEGETQAFRIDDTGRLHVVTTGGAGLATEVTLSGLRTDFGAVDFATQTTLAALLTAFNAEDFATQTTLDALLTAFNAEDFATQTTLAALLTAFNAEDFASETTLAGLRTDFGATDFATQTTLAALLTAFNAEDFATQTTLAALNTKVTTVDTDDVRQPTHDNLNANANLQVGDTDVGSANPVPTQPVNKAAQNIVQAQITVGTTAVRLTHDNALPDADRSYLSFRPDPNATGRFWFGNGSVTSANGHEVFPGESIELKDDANDYYIISDTAAQSVGIVEVE